MPRFDPTEFGRFIARLTPHELRQAEGMLAEARKRAEAVMEIDARAEVGSPAASCPRCECDERVRWGRTRTGAQRWRCSGCGPSCSGRSDTPIARGHRPDLMAALVRDMMAVPQPALVPPRGPGLGALA
jgi:transposase-like protein